MHNIKAKNLITRSKFYEQKSYVELPKKSICIIKKIHFQNDFCTARRDNFGSWFTQRVDSVVTIVTWKKFFSCSQLESENFNEKKISQILFFMGSSKNKDDATHEDFTCIFFNDLTPSNVRKAVKMTNFVSAKCNKKNSLMWCSWNWGIYIVVESQVWWFLMRKNV